MVLQVRPKLLATVARIFHLQLGHAENQFPAAFVGRAIFIRLRPGFSRAVERWLHVPVQMCDYGSMPIDSGNVCCGHRSNSEMAGAELRRGLHSDRDNLIWQPSKHFLWIVESATARSSLTSEFTVSKIDFRSTELRFRSSNNAPRAIFVHPALSLASSRILRARL